MRWRMTPFDRPEYEFLYWFDMDLSAIDHLSSIGEMMPSEFFAHGFRIPDTFPAVHFTQRNSNSDYPDLMKGNTWTTMLVSTRMRRVVEEVAPPEVGLQFVPAVITRKDGRPGPEGWCVMKVLDLVDSIIPELSEVEPVIYNGKLVSYSAGYGACYTFRDQIVFHRHIWVDRYRPRTVFISDEMRAAMMATDLSGVATGAAELPCRNS